MMKTLTRSQASAMVIIRGKIACFFFGVMLTVACCRYNIPRRYSPSWSINIFNDPVEKDARVQVKIV